MPEDKTRSEIRVNRTIRRQSGNQIDLFIMPRQKTHPFCVCSSQTILEVSRGTATLKCSDAPWKCPYNGEIPTPVV